MVISTALDRKREGSKGLLTRLRHDTAGNTLAMLAMATIPLVGMVGSAVDISRSYLIKARLQQACDAGVLASRRAMGGAALDAASIEQGKQFFKTNFANDTAGATNVTFSPADTDDNQVTGVASARVPMSITKVFGTNYIDLNVRCDARLEISNTDVMLVLDTTGSMACDSSGNNCNSGSSSKIVALREAVLAFYDTVNDATSASSRFRIGFVPYSSAVNMGIDPFTDVPILPQSWLIDSTMYSSRVANMTRLGWTPITSFGGWTNETFASNISNTNCTSYGNNTAFTGYTPAATMNSGTANSNPGNAQPPSNTAYQAGQPPYDQRRVYERVTSTYSNNKSCERRWRVASTTYDDRFFFQSWSYKPVSYDLATFKQGTPVNVYTANSAPTGSVETSGSYNMSQLVNSTGSTVVGTSTVWDGCIEERYGNAQLTFTPVPADSYDLDIVTTPTSDAKTKWRPMWDDVIYDRIPNNSMGPEDNVSYSRAPRYYAYTRDSIISGSSRDPQLSYACPAAASKLASRARADVVEYVNSLYASGGTFHDYGIAWGGRMASPTGLWASENGAAPNGKPVSRNLIFMTDGILEPSDRAYSSQGYERSDRRVVGPLVLPTGGNGGTMAPYHNNRFLALCKAVQNNNVTLWTVNFSSSAQPSLITCASDATKAFSATNGTELRAKFKEIAAQIAALRLSK